MTDDCGRGVSGEGWERRSKGCGVESAVGSRRRGGGGERGEAAGEDEAFESPDDLGDGIEAAQLEGAVDGHERGLSERAPVAGVVEGVLAGDDGGADLAFGAVVVGRDGEVVEEGEEVEPRRPIPEE